ncbi:MAG: DUF1232 domain-containing protein [Nanoarchaeota archaeon]
MAKKKNRLSWILFIIALIYLISPVDFIPDIPPIGLIDDAIVFIISKIIGDIKK